jgi:hypothetical protein
LLTIKGFAPQALLFPNRKRGRLLERQDKRKCVKEGKYGSFGVVEKNAKIWVKTSLQAEVRLGHVLNELFGTTE